MNYQKPAIFIPCLGNGILLIRQLDVVFRDFIGNSVTFCAGDTADIYGSEICNVDWFLQQSYFVCTYRD